MLYLKKYFTEGLIQFTILLSLIGVRVDVDSYLNNQLPPLREIILGPTSAYTQTQFHNLRNTLDGYGIHPKSVDLDHFFATRRLLNQVRSLDHLQVPSTEVSAWLVHRDPETVVSAAGQSSPSITLDNGGGLEDVNSPEASTMRGGSGTSESTYSQGGENSLGAVAPEDSQEQPGERDNNNDDLTKEVQHSTPHPVQLYVSLIECFIYFCVCVRALGVSSAKVIGSDFRKHGHLKCLSCTACHFGYIILSLGGMLRWRDMSFPSCLGVLPNSMEHNLVG